MASIIKSKESEISEKDLLSFTKSVYYLLNGKNWGRNWKFGNSL